MCLPVQTWNTSLPCIVLTCYMRNTCNYFPWYNTAVLKVFEDARAIFTPSNGQSSLFILPTQQCYARVPYIEGSPSACLQHSHWRLCPTALAPDLDINVPHHLWSSNTPSWNTKSQAWKATLWSYTMSVYRGGWMTGSTGWIPFMLISPKPFPVLSPAQEFLGEHRLAWPKAHKMTV